MNISCDYDCECEYCEYDSAVKAVAIITFTDYLHDYDYDCDYDYDYDYDYD